MSSSSWNEKINIHNITNIKKYSLVILEYHMLDRVIAQLYGAVFPHEGGHLPTTEDISYSSEGNKRM